MYVIILFFNFMVIWFDQAHFLVMWFYMKCFIWNVYMTYPYVSSYVTTRMQ